MSKDDSLWAGCPFCSQPVGKPHKVGCRHPEAAFDHDAWQHEVILRNVEKDPYYAPYCMRCKGLVRMRIVERHYWNCRCGAQCDYRPIAAAAAKEKLREE